MIRVVHRSTDYRFIDGLLLSGDFRLAVRPELSHCHRSMATIYLIYLAHSGALAQTETMRYANHVLCAAKKISISCNG